MYKIPYGISHFETIRKEHYIYVDKTTFIREIEKANYLIHLRPRRFGKSLFLSMLDCYYDMAQEHRFDELFKGLEIHQNPTQNRNNYYMLRFNFSGVQNSETENLEQGFNRKVKEGVERFIERYKLNLSLPKTQTAAGILGGLLTDFKSLNLPHQIYILIDEYDHFTNSVLSGNGVDFLEVLRRGGFVRSFYEIIKEQTELGVIGRIFITGVMSVTLDSMTSGFNMASNVTTQKNFNAMMGFTAKEVKGLLSTTFSGNVQFSEAEQTHIFEIFRENYNGYLFSPKSDTKIFNSTLIMYYLNHRIWQGEAPDTLVDVNLNQSGSTISNIVELKMPEQNRALIREIVENKAVRGELESFINIDKKFDQDDVITMLYNIGILTLRKTEFGTAFEIPNKIIQRIYLQYLSDLLQKQAEYRIDLRKQRLAFQELGESGDIRPLTQIVEDFLLHASNRNLIDLDEKHVKFIYFMLTHSTEDFIVYDEFPLGNGYGDIFIQKTLASKAKFETLIELKYLKRKETTVANIEAKLSEGKQQIEHYLKDERLAHRPDLVKYVIVFSGYEAVRIEKV